MGIFDKFKKAKNEKPEINEKYETEKRPFEVEYSQTENGELQIDFYDRKADFKQFYDSTRLIINERPLNIEGQKVYNCMVSWYGHNDCCMLNETTGKYENFNAKNYKEVQAQIDPDLLKNDEDYCNAVMKGLLKRDRVEKYLKSGLKENTERPCGEYVGGIDKIENKYRKIFSERIGKILHNSRFMQEKREIYRKKVNLEKEKAIREREAEIQKLKSEINEIGK